MENISQRFDISEFLVFHGLWSHTAAFLLPEVEKETDLSKLAHLEHIQKMYRDEDNDLVK